MGLDFETLKNILNNNFETYITEWFPNAYRVNNTTWKTGDFNDTKAKKGDGSLAINIKDKYAKDFSTGEKAGDIISIYAKRFCNGDMGRAYRELVDRYNLNYLLEGNDYSNNFKGNRGNDGDNNYNNNHNINNNYNNNNEMETTKKGSGIKKFTPEDIQRAKKVEVIVNNCKDYIEGDPVDLYLKSRNITKHSNDTKIYYGSRFTTMVNIAKDDKGIIQGLQQIYLTKDGKKFEKAENINSKIQRTYPNRTIAGHPVKLEAKGDNNGYIYITEGIENGLSIQEVINNEVWCTLSIVNIPKIPFDNDKIYILVFDNDYNKTKTDLYSTEKEINLRKLEVKYTIETNLKDNKKYLVYNSGEYHLKYYVNELKQLKQKHIFYIIPQEAGYDANDLLKENKLSNFINESIPQEIEIEQFLKNNKLTREPVYWRPQKRLGTNDNNNITKDLIGLSFDTEGIAKRFLKRYGNLYKKVDGIGICKYDGKGQYIQHQEDEMFSDIQQTLFMTYYEFDYLVDKDLMKSFKKLWIDRGVGEFSTIDRVEQYLNRCKDLTVDIREFDNENDNVINLANGYYDLDEGVLHKHDDEKKLFFRKLNADYKEDLNLNSPNNDWNKFLLTTFCEKINGDYNNDKEGLQKIRFLQKAMGYTFSTSIAEEKLFIIKGVTRGGKNTFLDTIQSVMEDYCGDTQDEEFITAKEQNNNYLLSVRASLKGKRFLHISEISRNKRLNGAQIKRLVGNRTITAKYMHHNSFSYKQQTKYWIATNNLDFTEFDDSIKTKLFIIDFDKRFYEAGTEEALKTGRVIDHDLKDRLLQKHNQEFILKWIIEGYRLYKKEGLTQTKGMQEALEEIEIDNDTLGMFVKDCMKEYNEETQYIEKGQLDIKEVYEVYKKYDMETYGTPEESVIKFKKFTKNMRARGFNIKRKYNCQKGRQNYITNWCLNREIVKDYNVNENNNNNNLKDTVNNNGNTNNSINGGNITNGNTPPLKEEYIPLPVEQDTSIYEPPLNLIGDPDEIYF